MISSVEELRELITQGESDTLEFKPVFGRDVEESAGAFANTIGGITLIGIADNGNITGVTVGRESLQTWVNQISNASDPRLIPDIKQFEIDGRIVVVVYTKEYPLKPVAIRGRCYRRLENSTRRMTPTVISEMVLQSTGTTWDSLPHPDETLDDINFEMVKHYISRANKTGRRNFGIDEGPETILIKLKLIKDGKPTWASVIAFGKSPPMQAKVKCGKIRGTSTIVDDYVVDSPVLDQVEEVMRYMKRVFQLSYVISGKAERDEIWEYPLEAVREVVTNAICHRDYTSPAQIQIKIFDEYLSIWNPGGLPLGMSVERLLNPNHHSIPRNRMIAMLFYDLSLIENYGSGIQRVINECRKLGFPDPEFSEVDGGFQVIFHKDIYTEDMLSKKGLDKRQIKAMLYVKETGKITNQEYQSLNDVSKSTATRDLDDLIKKSLIKQVGKTGKGTHYILMGSQRGQTGHKRVINGSQTDHKRFTNGSNKGDSE